MVKMALVPTTNLSTSMVFALLNVIWAPSETVNAPIFTFVAVLKVSVEDPDTVNSEIVLPVIALCHADEFAISIVCETPLSMNTIWLPSNVNLDPVTTCRAIIDRSTMPEIAPGDPINSEESTLTRPRPPPFPPITEKDPALLTEPDTAK